MIRLLAALGLLTLLSGCFQAEMKIEVLSSTEGQATTTITMERAMYNNFGVSGGICDHGELSLTETTATCVSVNKGTIEDLALAAAAEDQPVPVTVLDNGNLRIVFPLSEVTKNAPVDPQAMAMMGQMLTGSNVTIIIAGKKIVETNMVLAADGKSASYMVATIDLMTQSFDAPSELYAIVDPN